VYHLPTKEKHNWERTHLHPNAGYEKGNPISWNWLSSMMLASATTRLAVLNTCQEKISHAQKTLEFKKLQYKIPLSWTLRFGLCQVVIRNRNKPVLGGSQFLEPGTKG
jgi:hypothetical protein